MPTLLPLVTELHEHVIARVSPYHCLKDPVVELPALFGELNNTPARSFLEIGTFQGATSAAVRLVFPGCEVTTVDLPDPSTAAFNPQPLEQTGRAFRELHVGGIRQVLMDSKDLGIWHGRLAFDMIFVDGDHTEAGVRRDLELCRHLLTHEGRMVVHDYTDESDVDRPHWTVDVYNAVQSFVAEHHFTPVRLDGWLVALRQPRESQ
ncbi:MAG: class I SAM-dependent methyltransferase [Deltaproteobacteria bacterium]|nr:class I SAM-dependent methyltransferase [Deltaproteobacteria bacterium]